MPAFDLYAGLGGTAGIDWQGEASGSWRNVRLPWLARLGNLWTWSFNPPSLNSSTSRVASRPEHSEKPATL